MTEQESFNLAIFQLTCGIDLHKVNRDALSFICEKACFGNEKAIEWVEVLFIKSCKDLSLKKYCNCGTINELTKFVNKCEKDLNELFEKLGTSGSFIFTIEQITYFFRELCDRASNRLSSQQILILTGVLTCLPWIENKPETIDYICNFIVSVFKGTFSYDGETYSLTDYIDRVELSSINDVVARLAFALYILDRKYKNVRESVVEIPLFNYPYVFEYVEKYMNEEFDFAASLVKQAINGFFETNKDNLGWLEKYRFVEMFNQKQEKRDKKTFDSFESKAKFVYMTFNYGIYALLEQIVFNDAANVKIDDLFNNEAVTKNLLRHVFMLVSQKANTPMTHNFDQIPIKYFEQDGVRGIFFELFDCIYEWQSKFVGFIYNISDCSPYYYSAEYYEESDSLGVCFKPKKGMHVATERFLPLNANIDAFVKEVYKDFIRRYEPDSKAQA